MSDDKRRPLPPIPADYLIWSNEHRAWWRANRCGYATGLDQAGRYTRQEALDICRDAIPSAMHLSGIAEIPVRLRDIRDFTAGELLPSAIVKSE